MGAGGVEGLTEKERGENIKAWLICRRVTLLKCHVFSSDFWGWGGGGGCYNVLRCPLWHRGSD